MKITEKFKKTNHAQDDPSPNLNFLTRGQKIVSYTAFSILLAIRRRYGLDGMLNYMESYQEAMERLSPELRKSVREAMDLVNVDKIYRDVVDEKTE